MLALIDMDDTLICTAHKQKYGDLCSKALKIERRGAYDSTEQTFLRFLHKRMDVLANALPVYYPTLVRVTLRNNVHKLLSAAQANKHDLVLFSAASLPWIEANLATFDLTRYFSAVISTRDFWAFQEPLLGACARKQERTVLLDNLPYMYQPIKVHIASRLTSFRGEEDYFRVRDFKVYDNELERTFSAAQLI